MNNTPDALITAIILELRALLITGNPRHFQFILGLEKLSLPLNHRPGGGQLSLQTKGKREKPQGITVPRGILENPSPVEVIKRSGVKVGLERTSGRGKVPIPYHSAERSRSLSHRADRPKGDSRDNPQSRGDHPLPSEGNQARFCYVASSHRERCLNP